MPSSSGSHSVRSVSLNPITEVRFIVERELAKNFRSAKGIVLLVLSLLGGSSVALLTAKYNEFKSQNFDQIPPEQLHQLKEEGLKKLFDADLAHKLVESPEVLLGVFTITVWLTPLLVALMGFDAIAPDIQYRSVRYWVLRTRRPSYFVGKWLGLWLTVSAVTLVMNLLIWIVLTARGDGTLPNVFSWGVYFWLVTLPMSAVWCAMATLVSSLFRSPILALLLTFAAFFVIWVVYLIGANTHTDALLYLYPNYYDEFLLRSFSDKMMIGIGACFGMAAAYVGVGSALFSRRDV